VYLKAQESAATAAVQTPPHSKPPTPHPPLAADQAAHDVKYQWLLGWSLLISPVMDQGAADVTAYFPVGRWYALDQLIDTSSLLLPGAQGGSSGGGGGGGGLLKQLNGTLSTAFGSSSGGNFTEGGGGNFTVTGPTTQKLPAPLGAIPVHLRGGSIVPLQRVDNTTARARRSSTTLLLGLQRPPAPPSAAAATADKPHDEGVPPFCVERAAQRRANLSSSDAPSTSTSNNNTSNASVLIACGSLYVDDGESLEITAPGSALVWFTSVAAADGSSGDLRSDVARPPAAAAGGGGVNGSSSAAKDASEGLQYEEIVVVGLPSAAAVVSGTTNGSSGGQSAVVDPLLNATAGGNATANATDEGGGGGGGGPFLPLLSTTPTVAQLAGRIGYNVSIGSSSGAGGALSPVPASQVQWDGVRGVLRVTGLQLPVSQGLQLKWQRFGVDDNGTAGG